jgi:drug/metabolite transporter (DMT)-like permease
MDKEGNFNAAFYIYVYSGILILILLVAFKNKAQSFRKLSRLPPSFLIKTGIFFILNNVLLLLAVGIARKNEELVIVTLLNYTWPIMIYVIGIPLLKLKIPAKAIVPGIVLSFTGISLALLQGYTSEGIGRLIRAGDDNILAYLLAFMTSVSWAVYTNLTAKYKSRDDLAGIPFVFLISGMIFLLIQGMNGQLSSIHLAAPLYNPALLYMIAGPTSLGYLAWYYAMKRGNKNLVTSFSFFIPLLSLLIIHFRFEIPITLLFWLAVSFLVTGSYLCYRSFRRSTFAGTVNPGSDNPFRTPDDIV